MDSLIDLGYWGLFIGSFLASTLIPMSADVLLVGILALGGNVWACLVIATEKKHRPLWSMAGPVYLASAYR